MGLVVAGDGLCKKDWGNGDKEMVFWIITCCCLLMQVVGDYQNGTKCARILDEPIFRLTYRVSQVP